MSLLEKIESPDDLKHLNKRELDVLCSEIRKEILHVVATNGGHLSSNLGVVELAVSLHRVFSTPVDTIIWDVGHQAYPHKLITGRYKNFHSLRQKGGISGFPKREESPHDGFNTGHATTSISAAIGISQALFLKNIEGSVVAVIGDGALTGGMAFEAISCAGELKRPLIVVLNDNQMSISKNTGALSQYLSRFTMHSGYQSFKYYFDSIVGSVPFLGKKITRAIYAIKKGIKSIFYKHNIFVELGFEYVGPLDGHNITVLEKVLRNVKKLKTPVVVHVRTTKGKGYAFAEANPQDFHGTPPFNLEDGVIEKKSEITFTQSFSSSLISCAKRCENIVAITAAMASGTGLLEFKHLFSSRFFDVGIAEQHAVTMAAGLATQGIIPIVAIYSTFLQRSVDQIIHDVALQGLHVIFAVDRAGAVPHDGETHQGAFDISLFRCVPNLSLLSPASDVEMQLMMDWALNEKKACMIRYPKKSCPKETVSFSYPIVTGRGVFVVLREKAEIVLVCLGSIYQEVREASDKLKEEKGIETDIYNLRFIKPFDEDYFIEAIQKYSHIFVFEDGAKIGGVGEYIEALILKVDNFEKRKRGIHVFAFPDSFLFQGTREEVLEDVGLSSSLIADSILWNI